MGHFASTSHPKDGAIGAKRLAQGRTGASFFFSHQSWSFSRQWHCCTGYMSANLLPCGPRTRDFSAAGQYSDHSVRKPRNEVSQMRRGAFFFCRSTARGLLDPRLKGVKLHNCDEFSRFCPLCPCSLASPPCIRAISPHRRVSVQSRPTAVYSCNFASRPCIRAILPHRLVSVPFRLTALFRAVSTHYLIPCNLA